MSDVFLSYSSKDRPHAEALAKELQALGASVWLDSEDIVPGRPWEEAIRKAINEARLIAFLVEPGPPAEKVQREYMAALEHSWSDNDKVLLPILIGDAEAPSFLRHVQALRVRERNPEWAHTAKEIAELLNEEVSFVPRKLKRSKAFIKEQLKRMDLIERGANALRVADHKSSQK